ncbi:MAG: LacI family transcriptional regulator [Calditrichaeota bacterium]|nr:LacI family transcriptional regulator [Calditrichota bacterium]
MAMTIADIAKIAGVSRATVSGVLNNSPTVSAKTKDRILAIIKKYDYRPNEIARALALNQTGIIGLIVKDISNPLYSEIALGVEDVCGQEGLSVIIGNSHKEWDREVAHINLLKRRRVDGLIIFPLQKGADVRHIADLKKEKYPFVLLAEIPGIEADLVRADDEVGAFQATEHLINLGRKRIGYITGPQSALASDRRLSGYRKALKKHGLVPNDKHVIRGGWRLKDGYKVGKEFLSCETTCPDAVFCYNDSVAIGVMRAFVENGVRVPQDVAVVGFDDAGVGAYLETGLTTVAQPAMEIGRRSAMRLVELIRLKDNAQKPKKLYLQTKLQIRETCGANKKGSVSVQKK